MPLYKNFVHNNLNYYNMKNPQIPKIIHYCWFGRNPLPPMAVKCIESWKKILPDYEIKEWNEDNFDIHMTPYIEEAYHLKKYAFVSDFARFWVLYNYGGVYFDVDVEVIKPIDDIVARGPFMGVELLSNEATYRGYRGLPAAGLGMAAYPNFEPLKDMMQYYHNRHFISLRGKPNQKTVVIIVTDILLDNGGTFDPYNVSECLGFHIYPQEYFNPKALPAGDITITNNTRSIHHYAGSWCTKRVRGFEKHWGRFKNLMLRFKLSITRVFKCKK